jgi:hypothetical protein
VLDDHHLGVVESRHILGGDLALLRHRGHAVPALLPATVRGVAGPAAGEGVAGPALGLLP